ncbi:hypothetical protein GOP47_0023391 [Adiantum capillus-veneris]|uniref:Uncharacterized protein n=1 Tax=Adiantum capillus-veneris TaxID=13818 RepID=A0A9D4U600_ADICA|nr:hypothetical protein GOP47_0023391 [Adiantum capillus-veneris]
MGSSSRPLGRWADIQDPQMKCNYEGAQIHQQMSSRSLAEIVCRSPGSGKASNTVYILWHLAKPIPPSSEILLIPVGASAHCLIDRHK